MFVSDLDDTLFDEIDYVRSGYRAIGRELEHYSIMPCAEAVLFLEASSTTAEGFDDLSAKIWMPLQCAMDGGYISLPYSRYKFAPRGVGFA